MATTPHCVADFVQATKIYEVNYRQRRRCGLQVMSLTSYRAAPPRVEVFRLQNRPFSRAAFWGGFVCFDRLEDLAATYSPVP
jgi:hypothetical protein